MLKKILNKLHQFVAPDPDYSLDEQWLDAFQTYLVTEALRKSGSAMYELFKEEADEEAKK